MNKRTEQKEQMRKVKLSLKELSQIVGGRYCNNDPKPGAEPIVVI